MKLTTLEAAEEKNKVPQTTRTLQRNKTTAHFGKNKMEEDKEKADKPNKLNMSVRKSTKKLHEEDIKDLKDLKEKSKKINN